MQVDKVLVDIFVPSIDRHYDVYLQKDCAVHIICKLLERALQKETKGYFLADGKSVLCDSLTGSIYNMNKKIYELNIKNGHCMFFV